MTPARFAQIRRWMGMTQVAMAEHMEVSERQVRAFERGSQPIPRPYAVSLAADWHLRCVEATEAAREAEEDAGKMLMEELRA